MIQRWDYNPNYGGFEQSQAQIDGSFYFDCFSAPLYTIWGRTPFVHQINNMSYHRALSCFLRDNEIGEAQRRDLLYCYLAPFFDSKNGENTLNTLYRSLPTSNLYVRRALNNLCVVYDEAPVIEIEGSNEDVAMELLQDSNFANILQKSYRVLKLHNETLIRPYIVKRGQEKRLEYQYFTPDKYRYKTDRTGNMVELWIHFTDLNEDFLKQDKFYIWTKDILRVQDSEGKASQFYITQNGKDVKVNEYKHGLGVIPFQLRRLATNQDEEQEIDGGGLWELIKAQLNCNMYDFYGMQGVTFNAFPMRFLINWNLENTATMSANGIVERNGVKGGGEMTDVPPAVDEISSDTTFENIYEMKIKAIKDALKQLGLPASIVEDTIATPSGAALKEMRRELEEARIEDLNQLKWQDKELINLVLLISDKDPASDKQNQFRDTYKIEIEYADFQGYVDFEQMQIETDYMVAKGLISPKDYVLKMTYKDSVKDDAEAIKFINTNLELFKQIKVEPNEDGNTNELGSTGTGSEQLDSSGKTSEADSGADGNINNVNTGNKGNENNIKQTN